jgi:hypothetical protein
VQAIATSLQIALVEATRGLHNSRIGLQDRRNVGFGRRFTVVSRLYLSALGCAQAMTFSANLRAESHAEPVRFVYDVPSQCPEVGAFTERLRDRTSRGRAAEEGELARTFVLRVEKVDGQFIGSLEFVDASGSRVGWRVQGEQCDAVVTSLALITAVAIDVTLRDEEPVPSPGTAQARSGAIAATAERTREFPPPFTPATSKCAHRHLGRLRHRD